MEHTATQIGFPTSSLSREDLDQSNPKPIRIIRWLFYLFIFSLAFETVGEGVVPIEPPSAVLGLLLLTILLQPRLFIRWPPKAFWCFIIYIYLFVAWGLTEPTAYKSMFVHDATVLGQLTVLGWLAFNIMRDRDTALRALLSLALACSLLGAMQLSGMAHSTVEAKGSVVRAAAFGLHPNHLARIIVLGMLALVGTLYARRQKSQSFVILLSACLVMLAAVLLQTGSRGAILALGLALLVFAFHKGSLKKKTLNLLGLLFLLGILAFAAFQSDVMRSRFEETIEDGDMARREFIYPTAWAMFKERPLFGWGPVTSVHELGNRLGHPEEDIKNPHNLILYGIVTSGLVGSFPLFLGIGLAMYSAWKARNGPHGVLPLAMTIAVLGANMSGIWLFNKLHWVIMAYAVACISYRPDQDSSELLVYESADRNLPASV